LRFISLGNYRTPLYFERNDSYQSIISGLITICIVLGFIILSANIFIPILQRDLY